MQARARLWTSTTFSLPVGTLGQPGQVSVETLANLRSALGLSHMAGFTIIETFVQGIIHSDTDETALTFVTASMGIGVKPSGMDDGDYGQLDLYEGDWLWFHSQTFQLPGVVSSPVGPIAESASWRTRSHAQRRINQVGDQAIMIIQQDSNANAVYRGTVQHLVLMP